MKAVEIVKEVLETGMSIRGIVIEMGLMSEEDVERRFDHEFLAGARNSGKK
jgi:aspartate ammonia-lyase